MSSDFKCLRDFGKCRLDLEKKFLWHDGELVQLPLRVLELLCLLVESGGEVVSKDEILEKVWKDSFVEESNLTHNIYLLRKTLKDLGEPDLIQTVPRRGYRFAGEIQLVENEIEDSFIVERRTVSHTLLEEISEIEEPGEPGENFKRLEDGNKKRGFLLSPVFGLVIAALGVLVAGALFLWYFRSAPPAAAGKEVKTIAVLPLQPLDGENGDDAFGVGISESLAARLGSLEQIVVRPAGSVRRLLETEKDPLEIGRRSNADAVLFGTFQNAGGRLRVTVRLVKTADGLQIWSGSFDESEMDLFKLQDSLSAQVAASLTERLTPQQTRRLSARPTGDLEAYKLYLRGRHAWNKRTAQGFEDSIRFFRSAIDRDPAFAYAYAGLADTYVLLNDYDAAAEDAYLKAKAAAHKALEIDPELAEPRVTLAYVLATYEWNFTDAEREYRRAIESDPDYATAYQWYGEMLYTVKRFKEAEVELRRAAELDPLVPISRSELAVVKYYARQYDEAIEHFSKLKSEFPTFPTSYMFLAWIYEQKHMPEESLQNEIEFWKLHGTGETEISDLERAFREGGRAAFLQAVAGMLESEVKNGRPIIEYRLAHIYARLKDREKTLEWLEKGIEKRSSNIIKSTLDPNFDFLRDDTRFKELQTNFQMR